MVRRPGLSSGKIEVLYVSPNGVRIRSKLQLSKYLGDTVDLTCFDFKTGRMNPSVGSKGSRGRHSGHRGSSFGRSSSSRNDASCLIPPIRQTASIFKQPVTLIKTQAGSKSKDNIVSSRTKPGDLEKPRQLFWERRIQGLKVTCLGDEDISVGEDGSQSTLRLLPRCIKLLPPTDFVTEDTALRSLSSNLHRITQPVVGQTAARSLLEKNPGVYVNPEQPLVTTIVITEDDMFRQETRVRNARKLLQEAITLCERG